MMFPANRPIAPPMSTTAFMPPADDACDAVNDTVTPPHADYNLRPLVVDSLDHYIIHLDEFERFRVV